MPCIFSSSAATFLRRSISSGLVGVERICPLCGTLPLFMVSLSSATSCRFLAHHPCRTAGAKIGDFRYYTKMLKGTESMRQVRAVSQGSVHELGRQYYPMGGATALFPQPLKPCPDTPTTTDGQIFVAALNWAPRRMSSLFFVHSSPAVRSGATIHSKRSSHARHVSPDRLADCHPGSECRFDPRLCPRHVPHLLEMRHPERSPKDVLPALRPGTAHSLSLPPHISRSQPVPRELLSY